MIFDVIVVGGGPAGSTAAGILGQAGVSTLLLDRSSFPRDKPCGGGISARVTHRFPYLEKALSSIPTKWFSKVYFEAPSGDGIDYDSVESLYLTIRRCDFDYLLLSMAKPFIEYRAPALVRQVRIDSDFVEVTAQIENAQKRFRGRIVLGCDGVNGVVARELGLRGAGVKVEHAIDMMEETSYEAVSIAHDDRLYIYYNLDRYGYGYVFPKSNHLNLGIGFKLDYYLSELRGKHYSCHRTFVSKLISDGLIAGDSSRANFRTFPLPISGPLPRTYGKRVLLCGDAGGFVNALTGEGIYYAMVSGDHAARTAFEAVRVNCFGENQMGKYERSWRREIGVELTKSVSLQRRLLTSPGSVDRIVRAAKRNPALAAALARYMTGAISHAQLRRFLLLHALPLYVVEKLRIRPSAASEFPK
jgi:geranylgeranyl reductase family protein